MDTPSPILSVSRLVLFFLAASALTPLACVPDAGPDWMPAPPPYEPYAWPPPPPEPPSAVMPAWPAPPKTELDAMVDQTEAAATPGGRAVLQATRSMIAARVVVRGSCWDFAHAVYQRAAPRTAPRTVFKGTKKGPFAPLSMLRPGDWLYILHDDGVEHSTIFVRWLDSSRPRALVANYIGGQASVPGDYKAIDLHRVYNVMRLPDG